MSVMFSPLSRLDSAKVALVVTPDQDLGSWRSWCQSAVGDGVGAIVVPGTAADEALSVARSVFGDGVVGVAEPVGDGVRADLIHLQAPSNASRWPNRLVGCQVCDIDQARAGLLAGCAYLVVDVQNRGLICELARLAQERVGLIWFVSGCAGLDDLRVATEQGARRVWVESQDPSLDSWSAHLRQVWSNDPAMSPLARMRRNFP